MKPPVRTLLPLALMILACMAPTWASAKDCQAVADSVDRLLCSNPEFRRADRDMAAAYFALLEIDR